MDIIPEMTVGAGLLLLACATFYVDFFANIGKALSHLARSHFEPLVLKPTAQGAR